MGLDLFIINNNISIGLDLFIIKVIITSMGLDPFIINNNTIIILDNAPIRYKFSKLEPVRLIEMTYNM